MIGIELMVDYLVKPCNPLFKLIPWFDNHNIFIFNMDKACSGIITAANSFLSWRNLNNNRVCDQQHSKNKIIPILECHAMFRVFLATEMLQESNRKCTHQEHDKGKLTHQYTWRKRWRLVNEGPSFLNPDLRLGAQGESNWRHS